jgi:hypothetical protein
MHYSFELVCGPGAKEGEGSVAANTDPTTQLRLAGLENNDDIVRLLPQ